MCEKDNIKSKLHHKWQKSKEKNMVCISMKKKSAFHRQEMNSEEKSDIL